MANVDIRLGYKNAAWFTTNAALVLEEGQVVNLEQTGTYKLGDGITALSALSFLGSSNLGFTPEDVANKQTDLTPSATKYPTVNAVNAGLALKANINPRVHSLSSSTSYTLDVDIYDEADIYLLSGNITINAPIGTWGDGRIILYRIVDNGNARNINYNAAFVDLTGTAPTTTKINKATLVPARWSSIRGKWEIFANVTEP